MRIGFFTDGFLPQPNGVATSVHETAKELERRGHEVYIIAPKYPNYHDKNPHVIRLASVSVHESTNTRIALNLPDKDLRSVLSMDFDVIHGHSGGPITLLGWEVARSKKIPYVVTYHTLWNRYTHYFLKGKVVTPKMMERATKIFGNRADCLIAPTLPVEKELKSYGIKKPIRIIPSGIDTSLFKRAKTGELKKILKNPRGPIVLFVGRLGREKSTDFIIESFVQVLKQVPGVTLVIVGDGEEREALEQLTQKLNIKDNVFFTGHIANDKIYGIYKDADVFVFASKTETQGMIIPEALASGVPVVTNVDPAFDCIKDGYNGYRVEMNQSKFADKVVQILNNKNLADDLSKNAIASSEKFSVKETADLLEKAYFELLEKTNRESVSQIMAVNFRAENIFVFDTIFWSTVLLSHVLVLLFPPLNNSYPGLLLAGQNLSFGALGLLTLLLGVGLFLTKRSVGVVSLALLGVGAGLFMSELYPLLTGQINILDYWSPINIIPILLVGIVPLFFLRTNTKDRPRFYINTPLKKHVNPESPRVSVVIPAYNEGEFIEPTLKSILNQNYKNFELIVVDNNSSDNTAEIAEKYGARVILEKKKGVAYARQAGCFSARGEIIASTDADSVVPENWLEMIVDAYEKDKNLVAFGGLNNLYSGPVTARAAGRFLFPLFWNIDKIFNHGWNLAGFNFSVKKSAFDKIGGFDTSLNMGEDIDLAQRLRKVGDIRVDTDLLVYSSGRRFRSGLIFGLASYAPYWFLNVVFHKGIKMEFKDVRGEGGKVNNFGYVPLIASIIIVFILFLLGSKRG